MARQGLLETLPGSLRYPILFFCGALLATSSPGFNQGYMAWFALAPLLVFVRASYSPTSAALAGLCFGLGYYGVGLSWYLGLFPLRWLGLHDFISMQVSALVWLVESFHESLLMVLFSWLVFCLPMRAGFLPHYRRPFVPYLIGVPLLWVFIFWVIGTSEAFLAVPVNQLAYSQAHWLEVIQLARIGGSGAIDFVIVLVNAVIASVIMEILPLAQPLIERCDPLDRKPGATLDLTVAGCLVFFLSAWGAQVIGDSCGSLSPERALEIDPQSPPVPICVLQGNVSIEEEKLKTLAPGELSDRYADLAKEVGALIFILPEGVVTPQQRLPGMLYSRLMNIRTSDHKDILFGGTEKSGEGIENVACLISRGSAKDQVYVKQRLVPIGEAAVSGNLRDGLGHLLPDILDKLPIVKTNSKAAGSPKTHQLLRSIWGPVGTNICIETVYPQLVAEQVRHGATLLVNVSNLGWFHGSSLNKQILAASVLRAVENGRYLVLATNTGISAVIDPTGMVTSQSLPGKRGAIVNTVQFFYQKTPYTRMWWL